jgi:hypothetical protein
MPCLFEAARLLEEYGPNATPEVTVHPVRRLLVKFIAPVPVRPATLLWDVAASAMSVIRSPAKLAPPYGEKAFGELRRSTGLRRRYVDGSGDGWVQGWTRSYGWRPA